MSGKLINTLNILAFVVGVLLWVFSLAPSWVSFALIFGFWILLFLFISLTAIIASIGSELDVNPESHLERESKSSTKIFRDGKEITVEEFLEELYEKQQGK